MTKQQKVAELFSDLSLITDLPRRIGEGWDGLLVRLGLTRVVIYHIKFNNHGQLEDMIKDGLDKWNIQNIKEPVSKRAAAFLEALRAQEMVPLAEELEEEYNFNEPELVESTPDVTEDPRDTSADTSIVYTREASGDIMNSLDRPKNDRSDPTENGPDINGDFPLRDYQMEIAQDGLKGENSIIWARTGSGKTRVAVYIMKNHLDNNPTGKIAFFNTTMTLLDQQYEVIRKFLPKYKHQIMKFSGVEQNEVTLLSNTQHFRVCVLTPMTLEKYLAEETVSLDLFSMLVFDECHHTRKKEPYNQIMKYYRKLLQDSTVKLPQILGLTASVGTERACNVDDAEKSILELMARMNVHKIATPRINRKEYTQMFPEPEKHSEVMKDRTTDPMRDTIEDAMGRLETWLQDKLCDLDKNVHKLLGEIPDKMRMEQQYQSWLSRLMGALPRSEELTPEIKHQAIVIAEHLTMYQTALSVNHTLCMKDVLEHLYHSSLKYKILEGGKKNAVVISNSSRNNTDEDNTGSDNTGVVNTGGDNTDVDESGNDETEITCVSLYTSVTKKLEILSKNDEYENPNIVRLRKMVDKNFEEKGKDSTFIVFVEQRESAVAVSKYLTEKSSFAKCCFLISAQSTADGDGKQSQAEYNWVVQRLLSKQINGLVATQVAEEGLDIPACNFVIRYNQSSNEISTIQAAGRSRAMGGTVIDFANERKHRQEQGNVMKLTLMNQALEMVLGRPVDSIRQEVNKRMDSITKTEAEEEERSREAGRKNKTQGNFTLRCLRCQEVAVSSPDIRRYKETNYIVVGRDFYKKAKRRLKKKVTCYENMTKRYKVYCIKCGSDWGAGICMRNLFFAVLKIRQFIVRDDDTEKEYFGVPWSVIPHTVQTMTEEDFSSVAALDKLIEDAPDN
ncbi:Interferon-induced helicase C domain-containing protein 1 [Mizuhopecten yessoensis]|uniref:RNA helicase n=1 Tax=Mizuhopecten yessoensis TaxID=6573 RepID=A0A210R5V4_MIZYE|nr:Interferon-induced helicase C domain-containing protein 1 [Mizuhopecten yessoensis]